ncbi:MAG: hypothetical protein WCP65_05825 [Bacteroidota bacterium]
MELLQLVNNHVEQVRNADEAEQFQKELAEKINNLLLTDFAQLVQLLYRIDIDEAILKRSLAERNNEPAGMVIADMMIKRVTNTIATKKHFKENNSTDIDESLKW